MTAECAEWVAAQVAAAEVARYEQTHCRHCHLEIDRFGAGPWFHVATMLRYCEVGIFAAP